jgi:PadR family transcriptional regulator AphA
LGLLSLRPWSAYELAQQMKRSLRFCWPRAERGVYEEPKALVAHGLASATTQLTGARQRTVYEITPAGQRAFRRWLAQPSEPPQLESEALLRAQFLEKGSHDDAMAILESLREYATAVQRQILGQAQKYLDSGGPFPERLHVIAITGKFLLDHARQLEDWSRWAQDQVRTWPRFGPLRREEALRLFRTTLRQDLEPLDNTPANLDRPTR